MSGPVMQLIKRFLILAVLLAIGGAVVYLSVVDIPSPMQTIVEDVPDDRFEE